MAYTISVLRGDGVRGFRGRYETKEEAKKAIKILIRNRRTDSDTRNPRLVKIRRK